MLAEIVVEPGALVRRWAELAADPDAPEHYEINEYGELIMSPRPSNDHQRIVAAVVARGRCPVVARLAGASSLFVKQKTAYEIVM